MRANDFLDLFLVFSLILLRNWILEVGVRRRNKLIFWLVHLRIFLLITGTSYSVCSIRRRLFLLALIILEPLFFFLFKVWVVELILTSTELSSMFPSLGLLGKFKSVRLGMCSWKRKILLEKAWFIHHWLGIGSCRNIGRWLRKCLNVGLLLRKLRYLKLVSIVNLRSPIHRCLNLLSLFDIRGIDLKWKDNRRNFAAECESLMLQLNL